jgi:hypothetical protein
VPQVYRRPLRSFAQNRDRPRPAGRTGDLGERQPREDVFEQALACREPGLRQLADDLGGRRDELCAARRSDGSMRLAFGFESLARCRVLQRDSGAWRRRTLRGTSTFCAHRARRTRRGRRRFRRCRRGGLRDRFDRTFLGRTRFRLGLRTRCRAFARRRLCRFGARCLAWRSRHGGARAARSRAPRARALRPRAWQVREHAALAPGRLRRAVTYVCIRHVHIIA